jgi:ABC-type transporter Mla subunit MlaD
MNDKITDAVARLRDIADDVREEADPHLRTILDEAQALWSTLDAVRNQNDELRAKLKDAVKLLDDRRIAAFQAEERDDALVEALLDALVEARRQRGGEP